MISQFLFDRNFETKQYQYQTPHQLCTVARLYLTLQSIATNILSYQARAGAIIIKRGRELSGASNSYLVSYYQMRTVASIECQRCYQMRALVAERELSAR